MNATKLIIKKELERVFIDKKLVFSLFILPAIIMFALYGLMGKLIGGMNDDIAEHVSNIYIENAPDDFVTLTETTGYTETANINYQDSDDDIENIKDSILSGDADLLVVFDPDFKDVLAAYSDENSTIPNITLYYNSTETYSTAARSTFNSLILDTYKTALLTDRIGDLNMLTVFSTNEEVIANEDKENGQILAMLLPYLLTFLLFSSAMSLCIDSIAGEKERGTLASVLLSPIKRSQLVFGKITALSILASLSAIIYAVSMLLSIPLMMNEMDDMEINMNVHFNAFQVLALVIIMITLVYLYVGLVSLVSVFAKNMKEASTYITPLSIVVMICGLSTMFSSLTKVNSALYCIPVYGSALAISSIVTNEITLTQFASATLGNLVLAFIVTFGISKAFYSEKVMFNA